VSKPLIEHIDFYFNQDGLMVLTEKYLEERGYCCGNGCLHCPYKEPPAPVRTDTGGPKGEEEKKTPKTVNDE